MPDLTLACTHICEIDRAKSTEANSNSCDVGRYSATTNNCFFNFNNISESIPAGSTIISATLNLEQIAGGFASTLKSKVSLRVGNWGAFTWSLGPFLACDGKQFTLSGSAAGLREVDVTDIVKWIVENNSPHHIFRLERVPNDQTGTSDAKRFSPTPSQHSLSISYIQPIPCEPPKHISLPAVSETSAPLMWSEAKGDGSNLITGYEVEYSESIDGEVWGEWLPLTVIASSTGSGTLYVEPPTVRGSYKRFRLRTLGALGEEFYSDWVVSGPLRKNILPSAPSLFTASPEVYDGGNITLSWSGVIQGTSAIKSYIIQGASSLDSGLTWTGFTTLKTILSAAAYGSTEVLADMREAVKVKYRIRVVDTLDAMSLYSLSNVISMATSPPVPMVVSPVALRTTYSLTPRVLLKTGVYAGEQVLRVRVDSGAWFKSEIDIEHFSVSSPLSSNASVIFIPQTLTPGSHTLLVKAVNSITGTESDTASVTFLIGSDPFSSIHANITTVKAAHIKELRDAANTIRSYYGLLPKLWSEAILTRRTPLWAWPKHISELRDAVMDVVSIINTFGTGSFGIPAFEWLKFRQGRPRADIVQQLQDLIRTL